MFNQWMQTDRNIYILECNQLRINIQLKSLVEAKRKAESLGFKLKSPLWYHHDRQKKISFREYVKDDFILRMYEMPNENYDDEKRKTDLKKYLTSNVITKA